jgi:hypothetical protein
MGCSRMYEIVVTTSVLATDLAPEGGKSAFVSRLTFLLVCVPKIVGRHFLRVKKDDRGAAFGSPQLYIGAKIRPHHQR